MIRNANAESMGAPAPQLMAQNDAENPDSVRNLQNQVNQLQGLPEVPAPEQPMIPEQQTGAMESLDQLQQARVNPSSLEEKLKLLLQKRGNIDLVNPPQ